MASVLLYYHTRSLVTCSAFAFYLMRLVPVVYPVYFGMCIGVVSIVLASDAMVPSFTYGCSSCFCCVVGCCGQCASQERHILPFSLSF